MQWILVYNKVPIVSSYELTITLPFSNTQRYTENPGLFIFDFYIFIYTSLLLPLCLASRNYIVRQLKDKEAERLPLQDYLFGKRKNKNDRIKLICL